MRAPLPYSIISLWQTDLFVHKPTLLFQTRTWFESLHHNKYEDKSSESPEPADSSVQTCLFLQCYCLVRKNNNFYLHHWKQSYFSFNISRTSSRPIWRHTARYSVSTGSHWSNQQLQTSYSLQPWASEEDSEEWSESMWGRRRSNIMWMHWRNSDTIQHWIWKQSLSFRSLPWSLLLSKWLIYFLTF